MLLLAILSVPAAVRWRRRRARFARVRRGDTDALWAELADTTVDLGYVWSPARTPRQVARWLGSSSDTASEPLRAVTAAVERARYSPHRGTGATDNAADLVDGPRAGARRAGPAALTARADARPVVAGLAQLVAGAGDRTLAARRSGHAPPALSPVGGRRPGRAEPRASRPRWVGRAPGVGARVSSRRSGGACDLPCACAGCSGVDREQAPRRRRADPARRWRIDCAPNPTAATSNTKPMTLSATTVASRPTRTRPRPARTPSTHNNMELRTRLRARAERTEEANLGSSA